MLYGSIHNVNLLSLYDTRTFINFKRKKKLSDKQECKWIRMQLSSGQTNKEKIKTWLSTCYYLFIRNLTTYKFIVSIMREALIFLYLILGIVGLSLIFLAKLFCKCIFGFIERMFRECNFYKYFYNLAT